MSSEAVYLPIREWRLRRALAWLLASGVQEPSGTADAGGVWAWLDESGKSQAYFYSEITGYFVTVCVQAYRHLADMERGDDAERRACWLEPARAAATWLLECAQHESGAILSRKYLDPEAVVHDPWLFSKGRVAYFDCAMVGFGLLQLAAVTGEDRWLEAARRIGAYLLANHETADRKGRFAAFDVSVCAPVPAERRWSMHFGPFELKSAMFLDALAEATGDVTLSGLVDRVLEGTLTLQDSSGRFATEPSGISTHLHPHCYTLEGLLYLVAACGRGDLAPRVERGLDWMFSNCLLHDPPIQQWSERPDAVIHGTRSDVLAQALRAYEIVKNLNPRQTWSWETEIPRLYERLCRHETGNGGTSYGADETGVKPNHANAWAHFFRVDMEIFARLRSQGRAIQGRGFALV